MALFGLIGSSNGRERWRGTRPAVEDQLAAAHLDGVAGQADHALDEVRILARVAEHDHVAARGQLAEHPAVERRQAEREAVARIAVGPFRDEQIIADESVGSIDPEGC